MSIDNNKMTKNEFLKLKKRLDLQITKLTQEALDNDEDITSFEFEEAILEVKRLLLEKRGISLEEYDQILSDINRAKNETRKTKQGIEDQIFSQIKQIKGEAGYTPVKGKDYFTKEEIQEIKDEVFNRIKIPAPIIKHEIVKEIIKEKPIYNNTTKVIRETIKEKEIDKESVNELKKDIKYLQDSFQDIKIPDDYVPQSVLEPSIKDIVAPELNRIARSFQSQIFSVDKRVTDFNGTYLKLNQSTPQSVTGKPVFVDGFDLGDETATISQDLSGNLSFSDAITGTKTLAQLAAGGGGVTDHSILSNLNWAAAGHTIDQELDVGAYDVLLAEIGTPDNPAANKLKVYAKDSSGTTKLFTLDSDGTETELGAGEAVGDLPDLTDVDDDLTYDDGFVLQADGSKYTGAQLSHTKLDDIGGNSHEDIDDHIADASIHTEDALLLHTTGAESKAGLLTFSDTLPQSAVVPSAGDDLVNKTYADGLASGFVYKTQVTLATTEAVPDCTYDNGVDGVGATLTANSNGPCVACDGVQFPPGTAILVKDQADAVENGIYIKTQVGSESQPWILTRRDDYDQTAEVTEGTTVLVTSGDMNAATAWAMNNTASITMGTTDITFIQISKPKTYTASESGLTLSGSEFALELDGSTLSTGASGLKLAAGFGTANQMLGMDAAGTAHEYKTLTQGSNITITHTANDIEISSSLSGSPDYTYADISMHCHPASSYTYSNLPEVLTAASSYLRRKVDLTGAVQYRIVVTQATAGYAGSKLRLKYSKNNSTWLDIDTVAYAGDLDVGTGTGVKTGTWVDIASDAKQDVWLQLFGHSGDGVVDPAFRQIQIQIKYNSTIVDGSSSDIVHWEVPIMAHSTSNSVWTNMPLAVTEFMNTQYSTRRKVNLTNCTHYRICVNQAVAGYAGADFNVQYSTNGSTFQALDTASAGELDVGTGVGVKYGAWASIVDAAKGDVWIRLVGKDGNGVVDPSWRYIAIQFKEYTYGQGVTGNDTEVLFNDAGSTGANSAFTFNKTTGALTVSGMTFGAGSITDATGAIDFGNETLTTTGAISGNPLIAQSTGLDDSSELNTVIIGLLNADDPNAYKNLIIYTPESNSTLFATFDADFNLIPDTLYDICGNTTFYGNTTLNGTLDVSGITNITADTTITGDTFLNGELSVSVPEYTAGLSKTLTSITGTFNSDISTSTANQLLLNQLLLVQMTCENNIVGSPSSLSHNLRAIQLIGTRAGTVDGYGADNQDHMNVLNIEGHNTTTYAGSEDLTIIQHANTSVFNNDAIVSTTDDAITYFINVGKYAGVTSRLTKSVGAGVVNEFNYPYEISINSTDSEADNVTDVGVYIVNITSAAGATRFGIKDDSTADWFLNSGDKYILFRDADLKIGSDDDGHLDLFADESIDLNGNVAVGTTSTETMTMTSRLIVRTLSSDPKDATPANRPAGSVGEVAYYSGKLYICTNSSTPSWELITSS